MVSLGDIVGACKAEALYLQKNKRIGRVTGVQSDDDGELPKLSFSIDYLLIYIQTGHPSPQLLSCPFHPFQLYSYSVFEQLTVMVGQDGSHAV